MKLIQALIDIEWLKAMNAAPMPIVEVLGRFFQNIPKDACSHNY